MMSFEEIVRFGIRRYTVDLLAIRVTKTDLDHLRLRIRYILLSCIFHKILNINLYFQMKATIISMKERSDRGLHIFSMAKN